MSTGAAIAFGKFTAKVAGALFLLHLLDVYVAQGKAREIGAR